jgi:uncharacterized protein (TIGR02145 family)
LNTDAANYSTAGTYYFTRYAKDGTCNPTFTASNGTYTLTVAAPYPPGAGTNTYTTCSQIWSAPVRIAACDKTDFAFYDAGPNCRSGTNNNEKFYYYNKLYVQENLDNLCPPPWRVPDKDDFEELIFCLGNSNPPYFAPSGVWGANATGWIQMNNELNATSAACYWTRTGDDGEFRYFLRLGDVIPGLHLAVINYGLPVRCVR